MVKVALRRSYYNYTSMFSFFVRYYLHKFVVTDQNTFVRGSQHLKIARVTTIVCCQQDMLHETCYAYAYSHEVCQLLDTLGKFQAVVSAEIIQFVSSLFV